jgi:hypothetical protein
VVSGDKKKKTLGAQYDPTMQGLEQGTTDNPMAQNPAAWEAVQDAKTRREYWRNTYTQETSWIKPACLAAGGSVIKC